MKKQIFLIGLALNLTSCVAVRYNIHTVEDQKVYRSAQLPESKLEELIKSKNIKAVINLRGAKEEKEWYINEIEVCNILGINHYSVKFSARKLPEKESLLKFFDILDKAEYPILLHCKGGADRAGLASTIYKIAYENESLEEALDQLDFWDYGHLSFGKTGNINDFFELYENYKKNGGELNFRNWVEEIYENEKI